MSEMALQSSSTSTASYVIRLLRSHHLHPVTILENCANSYNYGFSYRVYPIVQTWRNKLQGSLVCRVLCQIHSKWQCNIEKLQLSLKTRTRMAGHQQQQVYASPISTMYGLSRTGFLIMMASKFAESYKIEIEKVLTLQLKNAQ